MEWTNPSVPQDAPDKGLCRQYRPVTADYDINDQSACPEPPQKTAEKMLGKHFATYSNVFYYRGNKLMRKGQTIRPSYKEEWTNDLEINHRIVLFFSLFPINGLT